MKTIIFNLFNGFNARYLIETGIIRQLKKKNRIIFTSYSFEGIKDYFKNDKNIIFYKLNKTKDINFRKNFIDRNLDTIKYYTYGGKFETPKLHLNLFVNDYLSKFRFKKFFFIILLKFSIFVLNKVKLLRLALSKIIEERYPKYYDNLFKEYKIDLVVCTSLGTFANDDFLMRAAKNKNIKTLSTMLSWDNSTTRGYPGCKPNYVFAWTNTMKNEITKLSDVDNDKIYITGSAQFDHYFLDLKISKKDFYNKFKLNEKMNTLFFATRGPNTYASNVEIIREICNSIRNQEILNSQLIVRVHPLHYNNDKFKKYKKLFKAYRDLEYEFNDILRINYPIFKDGDFNFFLKKENSEDLHALIKYSDVIINVYSTVNIEGAIFDKPLINISYQKNSNFYIENMKSRYDINIDFKQDHNQRILSTEGIINCWNDEELNQAINDAIKFPKKLSEKRKKIIDNEVGPNQGNAAKEISNLIEKFVKNSFY